MVNNSVTKIIHNLCAYRENNDMIDFFLLFLVGVGEGTTDTSKCDESPTHEVRVGDGGGWFFARDGPPAFIDGTTLVEEDNEEEADRGEPASDIERGDVVPLLLFMLMEGGDSDCEEESPERPTDCDEFPKGGVVWLAGEKEKVVE